MAASTRKQVHHFVDFTFAPLPLFAKREFLNLARSRECERVDVAPHGRADPFTGP
jgi:hypothetical protein